jgi:hypothetical protein
MSILLPSRRFMLSAPWVRNELWRRARAVPAVDFPFAATRSLTDVAGGLQPTFSRSGGQTVTNASGILESAASGAAAFEHDPLTGECLGVLLEDLRVNQHPYSEDTSQWLTPVNATPAYNVGVAPNGTTTADRLLETAATGLHVQDGMPFSFVSGTTYTYSIFVESINGRNFEIGFPSAAFTARFAKFALATGAVQSVDAGVTARIFPYPNNRFRVLATSTCSTSSVGSRVSNFINNAAFSRNYAGDTSSGLLIWGADTAIGSTPGSYIPTGATTATRNATLLDLVNAAAVNGIRSFYCEFRSPAVGTRGVFSVNDGTANERAELLTSGTDPRFVVVDGGSEQANINGGTVTAFTRTRVAMRLQRNGFACSINGGPVSTDNTGTLPTVDRLMFGRTQAGEYLNAPLARFTGWREELPDPALQDLAR